MKKETESACPVNIFEKYNVEYVMSLLMSGSDRVDSMT